MQKSNRGHLRERQGLLPDVRRKVNWSHSARTVRDAKSTSTVRIQIYSESFHSHRLLIIGSIFINIPSIFRAWVFAEFSLTLFEEEAPRSDSFKTGRHRYAEEYLQKVISKQNICTSHQSKTERTRSSNIPAASAALPHRLHPVTPILNGSISGTFSRIASKTRWYPHAQAVSTPISTHIQTHFQRMLRSAIS